MAGISGARITSLGARVLAIGGILLAVVCQAPAFAQSGGTLERIKNQGEVRLAFRADATPFSHIENNRPAGYSVELCLEVAHALQQQLKMPEMTVSFVEVTAENRFDAITQGKADLLCEATSATLSRRERMDFSISTFVSGASLAIQQDGPTSFEKLADKKVGVLGGTTTQEDLDITLREHSISAEVIVVKTHDEGLDLLKKGQIAAYFADRTILQQRLRDAAAGGKLLLADNYLTIEPYALAMPIDHDFRLAVDRALSRLFRTGGMIKVFRGTFDADAKPSELLKMLSRVSGLPE